MKCNKCGTENTAGSKFCCGCGSKLERLCPQCQQPVAENARFCSQCGANITGGVNTSAVMKDNVIAGDVNQAVHTNISNTTDQSVHASVVHIHQNEQTTNIPQDLRCHACGEHIPAAQKNASKCSRCGKYFCGKHLLGDLCATCTAELQLQIFEFVKQPNQKYIITKLKDPNTLQVTIPSIVDAIGDKAFMNSRIMAVTLPEGVLKIGAMAFANCTELSRINFPKSLLMIDTQAFLNCRNLNIAPPTGIRFGKDFFTGTLYVQRKEQERQAEEARRGEEARKAEETRRAEEARRAEKARQEMERLQMEQKRRAEEARHVIEDLNRREREWEEYEKKRKQEKEEWYRREYRKYGHCQHCGGSFTGLFVKTCMTCGRKKDY